MTPTIVTLSVNPRKVELFKTAVFRFVELHIGRLDEQMVLRTSADAGPDAVRAQVEFSCPDTAFAFDRFLRVTHPGLATIQ